MSMYGLIYEASQVYVTGVNRNISAILRDPFLIVESLAQRDIAKVNIDNLPDNWTQTTNNGFTHIRDDLGNVRIRIDPPDSMTTYPHKHLYDVDGNALDVNGNIVSSKSPDAHIPLD